MIVPGSPHAFMLAAAADPLDNILAIGHSVRLRASASAYFERTFGAPTDNKKWTFSRWFKPGALGYQNLLVADANDAGTTYGVIRVGNSSATDGQVRFSMYSSGGTHDHHIYTLANFRDPSAWYHIVVVYDSANATAADRAIIYINNARQGVTTSIAVPLNATSTINTNARAHRIGNLIWSPQPSDSFFAESHFIDGQALTPSSFGLTHPVSGQWRPKRYVGSYGANGDHLDFSDGSAATSSALGKDRSGNNNDWTPTNISVTAGLTYDWCLDTPTTNYATLDALDLTENGGTLATLSNGGLKASFNATNYCYVRPTFGKPAQLASSLSIKRYPLFVEYYVDAIGAFAYGVTLNVSGGQVRTDGVFSGFPSGFTFTTGDYIGFKYDSASGGTVTVYKNGVLQSSFTGAGTFMTYMILQGIGAACSANFGQFPFVHPPASSNGICQKNTPLPTALAKSTSGFVAVTDSGANVQATLAAARPGWTNYIEIFKRRDPAAEGWRWRFSSDLANYLDSSSAAGKAAFPSLTGSSYVGYALRVGPARGVATGTVVHINGVLDTITDGLGQVRKMILLKREDSTSDWMVYHPDLTAGKLLYLNLTNGETTDASISTVLSSSFVAAAALPTGTYRWIALAEAEGFLKLSKHTGNGLSDGPLTAYGFTPAFAPIKRIDAAAEWWVRDSVRGPFNENTPCLNLGGTEAEFGSGADFVAHGQKLRSNDPHFNATGGIYIHVDFAAFPFRYANAR